MKITIKQCHFNTLKNEKFALRGQNLIFQIQDFVTEFHSNIDLEILSAALPEGAFDPKPACLFN